MLKPTKVTKIGKVWEANARVYMERIEMVRER